MAPSMPGEENHKGQLGDGTTTDRTSPVLIEASGVSAVAVGQYHSLYLKDGWQCAGDGMEPVRAIGRRDDHGPSTVRWRWKVPEFR